MEKLYAAAPTLKKWTIIKFRPRRDPFDITYKGVSVQAESVTVFLTKTGPKATVTVLIPGSTESRHDSYAGIAFLLLDQALGEYDIETRVGVIDVARPSARFASVRRLEDLPKAFDALFVH